MSHCHVVVFPSHVIFFVISQYKLIYLYVLLHRYAIRTFMMLQNLPHIEETTELVEVVSDTPPNTTMVNVRSLAEVTGWPTPVRCEMNLIEWERQLKLFGLLEKHGHLLSGFKSGFHQGIPTHTIRDLKWFCPPNHSSALNVKDKIESNLAKEVAAKRMFGPFEKQLVFDKLGFFRSSPLGAVESENKSFRPINDLSFPRDDPLIP